MPDGWNLEKLLGAHASHPHNPDLANAFFRAGEIESWGRGMERIFSACRDAKSPVPEIQLDGHDLWVELPYLDYYLAQLAGGMVTKEQGKISIDGLVESRRKILKMVQSDPHVSKKTIAESIGISTTAIDKNIEKLKAQGFLKRVGSPKSGYWEILE